MLLLLLLSRFSHVRLCATPETAAHQSPLSLGFSRQEYWSGLPFPCPMHACYPIDGSPPDSSVPGILQARIPDGLPFPSPILHARCMKSILMETTSGRRSSANSSTEQLSPEVPELWKYFTISDLKFALEFQPSKGRYVISLSHCKRSLIICSDAQSGLTLQPHGL